jgi:hypothetical protein
MKNPSYKTRGNALHAYIFTNVTLVETSSGSLTICYIRFHTINFRCLLTYFILPHTLSNDVSRLMFNAIFNEKHTHKHLIVNHIILHYINSLQNIISSHRTDTIHWNKWLLAPSCPDKYEQLTLMQIFVTQKFITRSCIISNLPSCPYITYYILLQLSRKADTDCRHNVTSLWLRD